MKTRKSNFLYGFNVIWNITSKKEKFRIVGFILLNIFYGAVSLLPTLVLSVIVNLLTGSPATIFGILIPAGSPIIMVIIGGFAINVIREVLSSMTGSRMSVFSAMLQNRLQESAFEWALIPRKNMDLTLTSGDVSYRIKEATHSIKDIFSYLFQYGMPLIFASVFSFIYLVVVEIAALPIVVVALILTILLAVWRTKKEKVITTNDEKFSGQISNNIINVLSNLLVVNLFRAEKHEKRILEKLDKDQLENTRKEHRLRTIYWSLIGFVQFAAIFSIIGIMVARTVSGNFEVGNIIIVTNYSFNIFEPINQMGWMFAEMFLCAVKLKRVYEIKPSADRIIDTSRDIVLEEKIEKIEMKDVCVRNSETSIVKNINMEFARGEITVIRGRSGKGKTTAIRALCGLAERESGSIVINDKIEVHTMQSYLDRISVTMQSPYIFNRDVSENIFYPDSPKTEDSKEMFEKLNMDDLVERTYDSESEQNLENQLSGGEKKRICVTRGIVKPAEVFIFDEPTNELDNDNTSKVIDELQRIKQDAVVIVVTHDIRVVQIADKLISM